MSETSKTLFIMKASAAALLLGILAMLFIYSNIEPEQKRMLIPKGDTDLGLYAERAPAPDFSWFGTGGQKHQLSDYRGQVIYINFWAYWCGPCLEEIPALAKMQTQLFPNHGVRTFLVNLDSDAKNLELGREFVKQAAGQLSVAVPVNMSQVKIDFGVESLPLHLLIDKKGRVANKFLGILIGREAEFTELVRHLLSED